MNPRTLAKGLIPPVLVDALRNVVGSRSERIYFTGDYGSWEEAERASTGYNAPVILEKTREAMLRVKNGLAPFERDSVSLNTIDYPFPLLAGLFRAAAENSNELSVLDFGGSLGTSYFQCRKFLSPLRRIRWNVVEQPAHVAAGAKEFANDELHFYESIENCLKAETPDLFLLSSVVQYLPSPYEFAGEVARRNFKYIIVDRTPFLRGGRDRLTVQHVPAWIYPAVYPCWFLLEERFLAAFTGSYDQIAEFKAMDATQPDGGEADYKGFIFRIKGNS